jgi:hypothetical protein
VVECAEYLYGDVERGINNGASAKSTVGVCARLHAAANPSSGCFTASIDYINQEASS